MENRKLEENLKAIRAGNDSAEKEKFLSEEFEHILRLTARILKRTVTKSDEEFSIGLMAVSEALNSYEEKRGDFWNYAALVMKSRLLDNYRASSRYGSELTVSPDAFGGEIDDSDGALTSISIQVREKTAVYVDNSLRDEIEALGDELAEYGIDLFDLPAVAPKSEKTRTSCRKLLKAFFDPPPLTDDLKSSKNLQVAELVRRTGEKRKLIERHRKYLVAAILAKAGDYSGIGTYIDLGKE